MPRFKMSGYMQKEIYRKQLKSTQIITYLCLLTGTILLLSPKFMQASIARDIVRIIINSFLDFTSNARLKAEIKPAIGALIRSFRQPSLLSKQRTNLYPLLQMHTKTPNFAASF